MITSTAYKVLDSLTAAADRPISDPTSVLDEALSIYLDRFGKIQRDRYRSLVEDVCGLANIYITEKDKFTYSADDSGTRVAKFLNELNLDSTVLSFGSRDYWRKRTSAMFVSKGLPRRATLSMAETHILGVISDPTLAKATIDTVTPLVCLEGLNRNRVSKALNSLVLIGMAAKKDGTWTITKAGEDYLTLFAVQVPRNIDLEELLNRPTIVTDDSDCLVFLPQHNGLDSLKTSPIILSDVDETQAKSYAIIAELDEQKVKALNSECAKLRAQVASLVLQRD